MKYLWIIAIIFTTHLYAQSFSELWQQLLINNPNVSLQKDLIDASIANVGISRSKFYPTLAAKYNFTKYENSSSKDYLTLEASYEVFNGRSDSLNLKASILQNANHVEDLDLLEQNLKKMLALNYLKGSFLESKKLIYHENVLLLNKRHIEIQRRFNIGQGRKPDLIQTELEIERISRSLVQLEIDQAEVKKNLSVLLDIDDLTFSPLPNTLADFEKELLPKDDLGFKQAQNLIELASIEKKLAQAEFAPSVTLFANYTPEFGSGLLSNSINSTTGDWQAGVRISLPLFDGLQTHYKIAQKNSEFIYAQKNYKMLLNNRKLELGQNKFEIQKIIDQISTIASACDKAKLAFEIQETDYKRGMVTELEVLSSLQTYLNLKLEELDMKFRLGSLKAQALDVGVLK